MLQRRVGRVWKAVSVGLRGRSGGHPWFVSELLVCWPFSPTRVISEPTAPGAPRALSEQVKYLRPMYPKAA